MGKLGKLKLVNFPLWITIPLIVAAVFLAIFAYHKAADSQPGSATLALVVLVIMFVLAAYYFGYSRGHNIVVEEARQSTKQMVAELQQMFDAEMARFKAQAEEQRRAEAQNRVGEATTTSMWPWIFMFATLFAMQGLTLGYLFGKQSAVREKQPSPPVAPAKTPESSATSATDKSP